VYEGKIFISGGWGDKYLNDVWSTLDGIYWKLECAAAPWKARMFHSFINFNGNLYILGGHDGHTQLRDVWASADGGKTWTQVCHMAQWEGRQGHTTVVIDGYAYILGGFGGSVRFNDLWRSKDCSHWTLVNKNCSFSPRQGHACIAYKGSLFVLGHSLTHSLTLSLAHVFLPSQVALTSLATATRRTKR
jgi:photosystem II stability/assembly factor-like uncharacterized protein